MNKKMWKQVEYGEMCNYLETVKENLCKECSFKSATIIEEIIKVLRSYQNDD